jgi:hypothetical protein
MTKNPCLYVNRKEFIRDTRATMYLIPGHDPRVFAGPHIEPNSPCARNTFEDKTLRRAVAAGHVAHAVPLAATSTFGRYATHRALAAAGPR